MKYVNCECRNMVDLLNKYCHVIVCYDNEKYVVIMKNI